MFQKHKKTLILTSLLTLLPIAVGLLLWDRFPAQIPIHFRLTGETDGWSSVPFAVFAPPLFMLAVQWLCIWFTARDPGNQRRNQKLFTIVLWIIPILSNLTSYLMYALALGQDFNIPSITLSALGLLFVIIGNYMPKTRTNSTMGIKVPWTYTSEANWNATHRFAGKVWVIGGLAMIFGGFLPETWAVTVMLLSILILAVIPAVYSYLYYKKQKANGDALIPFPKTSKKAWIALVILLIITVSFLFAGDLEYEFLDRGFIIEADFYNNYSVLYDDIEAIEYREGNVDGIRVGGYGSFRLLMGYFQNSEFGVHTRYTYYKPEACIVLTLQDTTLVLSGETKAETKAIYQELLSKTTK